MFFDEKVLTVYGKNINGYTQLEAPGSLSKRLKKGGSPCENPEYAETRQSG
jgi:hypothetical protein